MNIIRLNGNNLNCVYNIHKFKLFPFVSVKLSTILSTNSYFPMQELENSEYQLVKYSSNEYWAEKFCAIDRKWHNSLLHSILHFISPFISPKLIFFSFSLIFFAFCAFLTLIHSKYAVFKLKNRLLQKKKDWYRYLSFQQIYNRCLSLWSVLISCENIGLV